MTDPQQPISRRAARDAAAQSTTAAPGGADATPSRARVILIASALAVVFLLLGTGAVFAGVAAGKGGSATPGASSPPASQAPTRDVPADKIAAVTIPTCSISKLARASSLKKLYGTVIATGSGTTLYNKGGTNQEPPASGEKLLTAAAAIAKLGPDFRITTKVVDGVTPGSITLVGQGDATLSAVASGQSVYGGAPTISKLASKTLTAYNAAHPGVPITQVVLDASYWDPSDNWDSSVPQSERTGGFLSETTALQVDGDRANPKAQTSPRSNDPVMRAGQAFVSALGLSGVNIITGEAENGAPTLASVQSQPVAVLVKQMLLNSDNTLAEMLARIISVKENLSGSSSSLAQAIPNALSKYGIDTTDISVEDGSGESPNNGVTPAFMTQLLAQIQQGKNGLQVVADAMPIAGKSGSLATRFSGPNAVADGHIRAKPGFIANAYTLSGYTKAADGSSVSFAFFAVGNGITSAANAALDTLATGVYKCGKNLTTN